MNEAALRTLLHSVASGEVSVAQATERLKRLNIEDLGFARLDRHRALRVGFPEVIYGPGKTPEQIATLAERLTAAGQTVLATRCGPEAFDAVRARISDATYHPVARCITAVRGRPPQAAGTIVVVTGGTSDIPVAEEAAITAELSGSTVERLWDVGVAGIHRLLASHERLYHATVIIAVAGMEGALPSVIAGLVDRPVVAVPTSVGYGAAFGGLAALLGMLNSCAAGLSVVNIDNGFGAGYVAGLINRLAGLRSE
ncbi:MAG: nickel pincer cofactor biosynthesis protein LarB [Chloroflexi bacterium]|nr:nickel pincer cofactor biosynthesis protein LarB [Chloroflexota bacterium]